MDLSIQEVVHNGGWAQETTNSPSVHCLWGPGFRPPTLQSRSLLSGPQHPPWCTWHGCFFNGLLPLKAVASDDTRWYKLHQRPGPPQWGILTFRMDSKNCRFFPLHQAMVFTFTFQYTNSKHLCLIFTRSAVFISKLQNFRAPGPYYVKSEQWQIGRLSY